MVLKRFLVFCFPFVLFSCESEKTSGSVSETEKAEIRSGETLFLLHCESCHGITGDKGISGAANLKTSTITDEQIKKTILNGNNKGMMPYKELITSSEEIDELVNYVKSLRK
jgi:mono/diheme cytochrome c family protein